MIKTDSELHAYIETELTNLYKQNHAVEGALSDWIQRGSVHSKPIKSKILFMGINPSYIKGSVEESYGYDPKEAVIGYSRYYKPFSELAKESGEPEAWSYMDPFYFRETAQDRLWSMFKEPGGTKFISDQLRITMRSLEYLTPDIIVVCNAAARVFFGVDQQFNGKNYDKVWMGYTFKFDEAFGVHVITGINPESIEGNPRSTKLVGTPVLFSSTLTYMDVSAKNRLAWQIRRVLKFRKLYFGLNENGEIPDVNDHIVKLLNELRSLAISKTQLIKEMKLMDAAKFRDREASIKQEILEILLNEFV